MSTSETASSDTGSADERDGAAEADPGVRVRLTVFDPPACPVADALPSDATASDLSRTAGGSSVEQFRTDRPIEGETPTFAADGAYVYRRSLPETACPCRTVEALGHPVTDTRVRTDPPRISFTLLLPSVDPLPTVIERLESTGSSVSLDRLTRTGGAGGSEPIVIDRATLTDRQREVLSAAYRMGYFAYPREASAEEVAEAVGIARSTFAEHLAAAHRQVIGDVVDG
ncbi:helix-turn-helix domain-containing protein [Halorubrum vacuolatum]|uniref:Uncharacterized protein n=1 Tax=Halorubrum vacuolatum TaxID=63740 RepID=A0A238VMQ5_HALVU|nr:helix-turn-helix domain-containing protein [Halorubrum vacuolatum]SNR35444.1 hypothetical protein SAMN06264855_103125 [Halorubrum vacuolatum]